MSEVYLKLKEFKRKYPMTVAWRIKSHAKIIDKHLNPGEKVLYAFVAQKSTHSYELFFTTAVVLTNKRILFAQKRFLFGYFYTAITPDMFNDLKVKMGLIWGRILIDTIKEQVDLSNIDGKALDEIETNITEYMMKEKKKYKREVN
jgi:hypothetical protein